MEDRSLPNPVSGFCPPVKTPFVVFDNPCRVSVIIPAHDSFSEKFNIKRAPKDRFLKIIVQSQPVNYLLNMIKTV